MTDGGNSIDDIALRLTLLREWAGYPVQKSFAAKSDIDPTEWNHFEGARRRLTLNAALKLRRQWRVTLDWLFEGDRSGLAVEVERSLPRLEVWREQRAG